MSTSNLGPVMPIRGYQKETAQIFHSEESLRWFIRKHRKALTDAGALLMIAGMWHAHSERFDAAVLAIGTDAAAARLP